MRTDADEFGGEVGDGDGDFESDADVFGQDKYPGWYR